MDFAIQLLMDKDQSVKKGMVRSKFLVVPQNTMEK